MALSVIMLTYDNGHVLPFCDERLQPLVRHLLDLVALCLVEQPSQHFILVGQVSLVDVWEAGLVVDEGGEGIDAARGGVRGVAHFNQDDAVAVAVVVDCLQGVEDAGGFKVVREV